MKIDGTGSVNGGNDNVKWSRELAEKLDAADGRVDGKISASVWNGFLAKYHSNGNTIKRFINLKRAEVSFDYYLNKKDKNVQGLEWKNWKQMLNVYLDGINRQDLKVDVDEPAVNPEGNPSNPQTRDEARQAEFDGVMKQSKIKDLKKFDQAELNNLIEGFEPGEIPDNAPEDAVLYVNAPTGERIAVSPNLDEQTGLLVYQKDGLTHKITFNRTNGKLISGEITTTSADGTAKVYSYTYNENGEVELGAQTEAQPESVTTPEPPKLEDLQANVDSLPICKDKMPTEEDLKGAGYVEQPDVMTNNGGKIFKNDSTGETIILTPSARSIRYTNSKVQIDQSYDAEGKPNGGRVVMISTPGTFSIGVIEKDDGDNITVTLKQSHKMPASAKEFAIEGVKGHKKNIDDFRDSIGIPSDFSLNLDDLEDAENSKEVTSADQKFKIKVELDSEGNMKITYSQKQTDGSFKEIGKIELEKKTTPPGTLRGYDYSFKAVDLITNSKSEFSSADWDDWA